MQLTGVQALAEQGGMTESLDHPQDIGIQVLAGDIPRISRGILYTPDTQSLPLADGVEHQPRVHANDFIIPCPDFTCLLRQVLRQKITKLALPDETDAGAVFFVMVRKAGVCGQTAYRCLVQVSNREPALLQPGLVEGMKKVGLVLLAVRAPEQAELSVAPDLRIVAGRNRVRPGLKCVIQEGAEFYFPVTDDIGIRGAPGLIFIEKVFEYAVPVFR